MSKLIRAEWYRLVHSGNFFKYFIVVCLLVAFMIFGVETASYKKTLFKNIAILGEGLAILIPTCIGTLVAVVIGNSYNNRTAYYEIMDGNSTFSIVLSKLIVYSSAVLVLFGVPTGAYFAYVGIANGVGETSNPAMFSILFIIIVIHFVASSVLMTLFVRSLIGGILISYLRYVLFEGLISILVSSSFNGIEVLDDISCWLITTQLTNLTKTNYDIYFIAVVFASFIVEFVCLYMIVYKSFQNKKFK